LSTNITGEELKKLHASQSSESGKTPLPGTPGGKLVGYAEAQRAQNPEPPPSHIVADAETAENEFERILGKPVEDMDEQDFYRTGVTFRSKDLTIMTDLHVVLKDKSMQPRWFNCKAGDGRQVQQAYMKGFRAVTSEDVEFCHAKTSDSNGALVIGDLACLMIPKAILFGGFYKANMETAKAKVNRAMNSPQGADQGARETTGEGVGLGRGDYFTPDIAQAQRVDASEARKLVYK